ncbi:hypothetical protein ACCS72_37880, partial [Rhizobium ruizarguesonis]
SGVDDSSFTINAAYQAAMTTIAVHERTFLQSSERNCRPAQCRTKKPPDHVVGDRADRETSEALQGIRLPTSPNKCDADVHPNRDDQK